MSEVEVLVGAVEVGVGTVVAGADDLLTGSCWIVRLEEDVLFSCTVDGLWCEPLLTMPIMATTLTRPQNSFFICVLGYASA